MLFKEFLCCGASSPPLPTIPEQPMEDSAALSETNPGGGEGELIIHRRPWAVRGWPLPTRIKAGCPSSKEGR